MHFLKAISPLIHTIRGVYRTCCSPNEPLIRTAHDCETGLYSSWRIVIHFKQYLHSITQSAMFAGCAVRQTNQLYVLRMIVKLAYCRNLGINCKLQFATPETTKGLGSSTQTIPQGGALTGALAIFWTQLFLHDSSKFSHSNWKLQLGNPLSASQHGLHPPITVYCSFLLTGTVWVIINSSSPIRHSWDSRTDWVCPPKRPHKAALQHVKQNN